MAVDEMKTNSDTHSKKRKKSQRGSEKKISIELSNSTHEEAIEDGKNPSVTTSHNKKRKSKKLKLSIGSPAESAELAHKDSEISSNFVSDEKTKKTPEQTSAIETADDKSTPQKENDSSISQSTKKKKKKGKKTKNSQANSASKSSICNKVDNSSATNSENSKKKKRKKKSTKKNESTNSSSKNESSPNSNAASSRSEKAILYLETWKNDRNKWKFEKLTQFWLCKNMFDKIMVRLKNLFLFLFLYFFLSF